MPYICGWPFAFVFLVMLVVNSAFSASQFSFRCADDQYDYIDPVGNAECRQCSACPPGYGITRLCSRYNDTVCHPCSRGTYSSSTSRWSSCLKCKSCANHQLLRTECTSTTNSDCKRLCEPGYYFDNIISRCNHCNYCYQNNGVAVRIPECHVPGIPEDYQCMIIGRRTPVNNHPAWPPGDQGNAESTYAQSTRLKVSQPSSPSHIPYLAISTPSRSLELHTDTNNYHRTPVGDGVENITHKILSPTKRTEFVIVITMVFGSIILVIMFVCYKCNRKTCDLKQCVNSVKEAHYKRIEMCKTTDSNCSTTEKVKSKLFVSDNDKTYV